MSHNTLISTGNILALDEPKKKASQNPTEELTETLKIVLKNSQKSEDGAITKIGMEDKSLQELDRKNAKITVKVFMSSPKAESLKEAMDKIFIVLGTNAIESLVISYTGANSKEDLVTSLKCLWPAVEEYVTLGLLSDVGLSDVNTNEFIDLFQWAKVKPNIVQISLATCCVVPPALQKFTMDHEVQLLTHSDPGQILPQEALNDVFGNGVSLHWIARYQIHLKCRGILSSKGYLVYIKTEDAAS
ncbi:hypothetical protein KM043_004913 [Ampulex compressa]|nr:hypothetical protein KM043_004913 [Ampulex compressa]